MKTASTRVLLLAASVLLLAGCLSGGFDDSSLPSSFFDTGQPGGNPALPGTNPVAPGNDPPAQSPSPVSSFSVAVDINNAGQTIGYAESETRSGFTASIWTVDGSGARVSAPTPLNPVSGSFSAAFCLDEAGNVVGQSSSGTAQVAVLWRSGSSEATPLPGEPGSNSSAFGISPDGKLIVGEVTSTAAGTRAALWHAAANGDFTSPPQLLPVNIFAKGGEMSRYSSAIAVNDEGWIVGLAEDGNGISHAALWRPGAYSGTYAATDLRSGGEAGSIAYALSAAGKVVGVSERADGLSVPVQWTAQLVNGSLQVERTTLGSSGGALAINSSGTLAAGWLGDSPLATAWLGPAATPATLFASDSQVFGINDNNLVVGIKKGEGFVERIE